ncbi:hypothetical protein KFE25_009157 [Diacronema lutheri]|mgnify:CR=1 FL=1|uniref:Uncharacterized protein n=1 Tax=Diacronema lutheri TaxID=2081491 RepID=A0A8J6CH30_DIALT|nr:hypothetical protein KFE25_009157 [Diacronema lutheri]
MASAFTGRFADFVDFADGFKASFSERTRVRWGEPVDAELLESALTLALTDDTLGTVLSARDERDPRLLAVGSSWHAGGLAMWQALEAIYGQYTTVLAPLTEAQYHVACDARSHTLCPHCKVRARRLLDAAQQRRWGLVVAEIARDERLVNYLPEERERPDDSSRERSSFGVAHWAAWHGDADVVRELALFATFRPSLETRKGRIASQVASDVARARRSFRHSRVAAMLSDLEVALERPRAGMKRSYETESRRAFVAPPVDASVGHRQGEPRAQHADARPDFRKEAPYRWPEEGLASWPEGFRRR